MSASRPNIVIFMPEQWRGDTLGCVGHPVVQTPHFDRMAEEGMVFSQCYTTNPICGPSRCSFATGWYPYTRGHRTQEYLIREDEPNLFGQLKEAGYHTLWFGKNDMLGEATFRSSIDTAYVPPGKTGRMANPYAPSDPHRYTFYHGLWDKGDASHWDDLCVWEAQRLITESLPEPFCVFLPLEFVHPPYWVEEPFFSRYSPENVGHISPPLCEGKPKFMDLLYEYSGLAQVKPEHVRKIRAVYYGMVTRTDALFGQLVATLKEAGLYDHTAIFFMADHGNYAGDFGVPTKWWTGFEDALVRVPCAVRLPQQVRTGTTGALIQIIDVAATILDLAGVESAWPHFGRSLMPLLEGRAEDHREAVFADSGFNPRYETPFTIDRSSVPHLSEGDTYYKWSRILHDYPDSAARARMIRTECWKYIWRACELDELYDLFADPHEEINLLYTQADRYKQPLRILQEQLLEWSILTGDVISPVHDIFGHLKRQ